jgi:hypothetical protein
MPHHSHLPYQGQLPKEILEKLGATGEFPKGKIDPTDEGQLQFAISNDGEKILIHFGKPVAWMGLDPSDARSIAEILIIHADRIEGKAPVRG